MKLLGYLKGNGKLGNMIVASVAGETIARDYNPNVANPSTEAQVDQRAKLKLASQVAAALAPVIAIPREGLKSSRNLFIKKNFAAFEANSGVAQVTYENLQLTNGNAALPSIEASRSQESGISINLSESAASAASRVVYIMYKKNEEGQLQYINSVICQAAGAEGKFPATLPYTEGELVFFAYGMNDLSSKATATYGDYNCANGVDVARLLMSRKISSQDMQLTKTRGTTLFSGDSETTQVPDGSSRVYVTASGPGSVSGAGVFEDGTSVTVVATPSENATFVGWKENGSDQILSTNASYTFILNGLTDLVAVFRSNAQVSEYNISVVKSGNGEGSASMLVDGSSVTQATIEAGSSVTLIASAAPGSNYLAGWRIQGQSSYLTTQGQFTVTPNADTVYEAVILTSAE